MRFFTAVLTAVAAFTALVSATGTNPVVTDTNDNQINYPVGGIIGSGSPITIKWSVGFRVWEFGLGGLLY